MDISSFLVAVAGPIHPIHTILVGNSGFARHLNKGHQNYYDQNQYMMYPGYGHQSKSSSLPLTSVQTFFTPEGTLNLDNTDYPFKNKFPRLKNYENEDEIREAFKTTLDNVNDESFDPEAAKNGAFFILRSTNDENIHKVAKCSKFSRLNMAFGRVQQPTMRLSPKPSRPAENRTRQFI